MYSTCTFCHAPLGKNEALERFPVGRRVAFDQANGRLWAVCPSCRQWNLSPLETRWEAIEEGERLFRDTRLRFGTSEIGLALAADGTELIRIGKPLLPEMAAWRYGARFERRWVRNAVMVGGASAAALGVVLAGPVFGLIGGGLLNIPNFVNMLKQAHDARRVVGRFKDNRGPFIVNVAHVNTARVVEYPRSDLGWAVAVRGVRAAHPRGRFGPSGKLIGVDEFTLHGSAAREAARVLLPRINAAGGRRDTVDRAVKLLADARDGDASVRNLLGFRATDHWSEQNQLLTKLPAPMRLALEMSVHEERERRALQSELHVLLEQWREAEEIAAIADDLTSTPLIMRALESLRSR